MEQSDYAALPENMLRPEDRLTDRPVASDTQDTPATPIPVPEPTIEAEEWKWYVPFRSNTWIEVSNMGRVRFKGSIMSQIKMPDGYKVIIDGKRWFISKLVAATFLGLKNSDYTITHKNKDRSDNRVSNLEYVLKNTPDNVAVDLSQFNLKKEVPDEDLPF